MVQDAVVLTKDGAYILIHDLIRLLKLDCQIAEKVND